MCLLFQRLGMQPIESNIGVTSTPPRIVVPVLMRVKFLWPDDINAKEVERPTSGNPEMVDYPLLRRLAMTTMFPHDAYESFTELGWIGIRQFRVHPIADLTIDSPKIFHFCIAEQFIGGDMVFFTSVPDGVYRDLR
jgi:hypothetical protein